MKIYYTQIVTLSEREKQQVLFFLPEERVERILRMKSEKSQMQSITAGLLLEYALREMGFCGKELTFLKNADGKPHIKELPEFYYNLTHCAKCAALVTDSCEVGIDVEGIHKDGKKLAERFFAEEEKEALLRDFTDEAFTKIWTRKESYLKATGIGMRMPLNGFSVLEEKVLRKETIPLEMVSEKDSYYIKSFPLKEDGDLEDIWLSVCRKNESFANVEIEWKNVTFFDFRSFLDFVLGRNRGNINGNGVNSN